jgi:BatD DUF11 like domain
MKSIRKPSNGRPRHVCAVTTTTLGLLMLGASASGWTAVHAQLERTTVQEGETLTLSIESDERQSAARPDLAPLRKDFDVLGTSTSSETSVVNGSRSDRTRWLVQLQPRHTGTLDIPPITVGGEHTAPLVLDVTRMLPQAAIQASTHVFLEVEAAGAGNSIYVQQQIPYTVRLYYDDTLRAGELSAPGPANAVVEQLGEDKRYTATRDGREYNVIERHYAIAPEKSGALRIPSATFRGSAVVAQTGRAGTKRGDDLMARLLRDTPFANDSFFNSSMGAGMGVADSVQPVVVRGREITLDVQPRPAGAQGHWLPAEQIILHDSWQDNPPQFKVGEPVTRTVTISAKGLAAAQIPPLSIAQPGNARLYPEAPENQSRTDGKTIYGISKQSVTYIPTAQGRLSIPPIGLAWWDTRTNTQSRAVLPARGFMVEAGAAGGQAEASPPASAAAGSPARPAATPSTAPHAPQSASLTERLLTHRVWLGGAVAMVAAVVLAGLGFWRFRRRGRKSGEVATRADPVPRRKTALRALQQACAGNDRKGAADALLDLARAEWPDDPPRGLSALAARLESGGIKVSALNRSLYGSGGSDWQGSALWSALRHGLQPKCGKAPGEEDGLDALYPQKLSKN